MRWWLGERGLEARSPHVAERFLAPRLSGAITDAPALVSGLDDVAVVGQAIEDFQALFDQAVTFSPFDIGNKPDAAGIVFIFGVV